MATAMATTPTMAERWMSQSGRRRKSRRRPDRPPQTHPATANAMTASRCARASGATIAIAITLSEAITQTTAPA